jgi:hypothetical protein
MTRIKMIVAAGLLMCMGGCAYYSDGYPSYAYTSDSYGYYPTYHRAYTYYPANDDYYYNSWRYRSDGHG